MGRFTRYWRNRRATRSGGGANAAGFAADRRGDRKMRSLGETLLRDGWIDEAQLERALAQQKELGGRLGTCLLEQRAVSEERLLIALAEQSGVPAAVPADLDAIPEEVIQLMPSQIAAERLAIPFRSIDNTVDVALTDVLDLARVDELSFALGKKVQEFVATEVRVHHALERYYGIACPDRFRDLAQRLFPQVASPPVSPASLTSHVPPEPSPAAANSSVASAAGEARGQDTRRIALVANHERTSRERSFRRERDWRAALADAESIEEIGKALLEAVNPVFTRTLLLRFVRGRLSGWLAEGPDVDRGAFRDFSVSLRAPMVFRKSEAGKVMAGAKQNDHLERLAQCWGGTSPPECVIVPVPVGSRTAAVLYGDRGPFGVESLDVAEVTRIAELSGQAMERLILKRKRGTAGG